jgi:hypothetical protein
LIILIILGEEYKLWSSLLCSFLQPPVTLSPSALCSQTPSVYVPLLMSGPSFAPMQNHRQNYSFMYSDFYTNTVCKQANYWGSVRIWGRWTRWRVEKITLCLYFYTVNVTAISNILLWSR